MESINWIKKSYILNEPVKINVNIECDHKVFFITINSIVN